jgi:hypothetical protein
VVGANTQPETAEPLITFLMARDVSRCRVPIKVVDGNLADKQLGLLFQLSFYFLKGFFDEVFSITLFRSWIFNYE